MVCFDVIKMLSMAGYGGLPKIRHKGYGGRMKN